MASTEKAPRGTTEKVTREAAPPPGLGPRAAAAGPQEVSGSSKELQCRAEKGALPGCPVGSRRSVMMLYLEV